MLSVTVDTLVDEADGSIADGDVSLRDAIANAPAGETIDFSVTGTINLTLGQLVIYKDLTIAGPGSGSLTIDASGNDSTPGTPDGNGTRIFLVNDFDGGNLLDVTIGGVKLTNGDVSGYGGAIYSLENLTLSDTNISQNNSEADGGGIYASSFASLEIIDSTINQNAGNYGGGVYASSNVSEATFYVTTTVISENDAHSAGAIYTYGSSIQIDIHDSQILDNTADYNAGVYFNGSSLTIASSNISQNISSFNGGGLTLSGDVAEIVDSTFEGNTGLSSSGKGGAIYVSGTDTHIANTTFSNNSAGNGGGIYRHSGSLDIEHSTIFENTATNAYGGIYFGGSDTEIGGTLSNSIVAGNTANAMPSDVTGTIFANYNLIESPVGVTVVGPGNILEADPLLGPLQDNGGPTLTHELLAGSPAIDAGDPAAVAGVDGVPLYDQRGFAYSRVVGGRIDIGAFEYSAVSADFDSDTDVDGSDFLIWQRGYSPIGNAAVAAVATSSTTNAQGDADGNGTVDELDLAIWQSQFGLTVPPAGAEAVAAPVAESVSVETTAENTAGALDSLGHDEALALSRLNSPSFPARITQPLPTENDFVEVLDSALAESPVPEFETETLAAAISSRVLGGQKETESLATDEVFSELVGNSPESDFSSPL